MTLSQNYGEVNPGFLVRLRKPRWIYAVRFRKSSWIYEIEQNETEQIQTMLLAKQLSPKPKH